MRLSRNLLNVYQKLSNVYQAVACDMATGSKLQMAFSHNIVSSNPKQPVMLAVMFPAALTHLTIQLLIPQFVLVFV